MNTLSNALGNALSYIRTIGIADVVDILLVAYLIYKLIQIARRTNSYNLAKGLILFLVALWVAEIFELTMISFILRKATELGLLVLVVLFQPELRHVLEKLGSRFSSRNPGTSTEMDNAITQTVLACSDMSDSRTGALIIFERNIKLNDIIATGTVIDASLSAELLKNIFFVKAPLHDGAVVVREGRIMSAGCVLPLTSSTSISKDLGMRHRAGIGMSERSDAVVLIVSEETGAISCAMDGSLKRHMKPQTLEKVLRKELTVQTQQEEDPNIFTKLVRKLFASRSREEGEANEENL